MKMCLAAVSYTFALVRAFLSPSNFATASCAHFLPRSSPPPHIGWLQRPRSLHGAEPAGEFRTNKRNRSVTSATSQIRRQDAMARAGSGCLRQRGTAFVEEAPCHLPVGHKCASQRNSCDDPCHIGGFGAYPSICSRRNSLEVPQQGARPEK